MDRKKSNQSRHMMTKKEQFREEVLRHVNGYARCIKTWEAERVALNMGILASTGTRYLREMVEEGILTKGIDQHTFILAVRKEETQTVMFD